MGRMEIESTDTSISSDEAELFDTIQQLHFMKNPTAVSRRLTNALVEHSEICVEDEASNSVSEVTRENSTCIERWLNVIPFPKYVVPKKIKRNVNEESSKSATDDHSSKVTTADQVWNYLDIPLWKACVEPVTYRYISNNGRYRNCKLLKRLQPPKQVKGKHSGYEQLSVEKKQLQREIQKELKREFEQIEKQRTLSVVEEMKSGSNTERGTIMTKRTPRRVQEEKQSKRQDNVNDVNKSRTKPKDDMHINKGVNQMRESKISVPLPPINVPLVHSIASKESFIEQFTSRLSALEQEMRVDVHSLRKSREELSKISKRSSQKDEGKRHFRSRSEPPVDTHGSHVYEQFAQKVPLAEEVTLSARVTTKTKGNQMRSSRSKNKEQPVTGATHIRYTSTSGDSRNSSKYGYAGPPPASTFYGSVEREDTNNSVGDSTDGSVISALSLETNKDSLQNILRTLKITTQSGRKLCESSSSNSSHLAKSKGDNLGKSKQVAGRTKDSESESLLPQISGKKVVVAGTSQR